MKNCLFTVFTLLMTSLVYCQIQFEEGYYINDSGQMINGFIENVDWNDNPKSFNFKINDNSEIQLKTFEGVSEFGLANLRFLKSEVEIDLSRDQVRDLTTLKAPDFTKKTVFLKYIQDGFADLFMYRDNSVLRYFYRKEEESPQQLVYKRYLQGDKIAVNNYYQQQLFANLNCENNTLSTLNLVAYNQIDLEKYFNDYNTCKNSVIYSYDKNSSNGKFNLKLLLGLDFSGMDVERGLNADGISFDNDIFIRGGMEIEYLFPFNGNKWSAFLQPSYRSFKGEKHLTKSYEADLSVDYTSIELAFGVRHYIFLNNVTKIFLNALVSGDLPIKTEVLFANTNRAQDPFLDELKSGASFGIGGGLSFKDKAAIEFRYNTSRDLSGEKEVINNYYLDWRSNYNSFSIIVNYNLF